MNKFWLTCVSAFGVVVATSASAQIVVGQTAGFPGAVAATVKETTEGAKLYINAVNARGGVNGQQIETVSLDDKFDSKLIAVNAPALITEKSAVALFLTRGALYNQLIIPVLDELKVPLIGPSLGATLLHTPVKKYALNVGSNYQLGAAKGSALLGAIGITNIGLLHVDDTFGADGSSGFTSGFETANLKPVFAGKYDRTKPDFTRLATEVKCTSPQAVFVIG